VAGLVPRSTKNGHSEKKTGNDGAILHVRQQRASDKEKAPSDSFGVPGGRRLEKGKKTKASGCVPSKRRQRSLIRSGCGAGG